MKFGPLQKAYFNADDGAYSIVTEDERNNSQITITETDGESTIVTDILGTSNIPRKATGGVRQSLRILPRSGTEQQSDLAINFPKHKGNELRIYRSVQSGFDYEAHDIWFVFRRGSDLVVGSMRESDWRSIGTSDSSDDAFQAILEDNQKNYTPVFVDFAGRKVARDPAISRQAILNSGYVCEYTQTPTPFTSKRTGKPYLEAHHLIPLGFQNDFSFPLDKIENIVALNPLWHRAIHHAEPKTVQSILTNLANRRKSFLQSHKIDHRLLIELYGCEDIA